MYFTLNNIKRARVNFFFFSIIYVLSYIQLAIYYIFMKEASGSAMIYQIGFLIGVYGFLGGGAGIHYLIIRNYSHEMGNLETLGITRLSYLFQYWLSYALVSLASFLLGMIIFLIGFYGFMNVQYVALGLILAKSFLNLFIFYNLFTFVFLFLASTKDPFHLIKEKP